MESIYDELDQIKLEAQKLSEECRAKTELSDNLKRAHIEQLAVNRQANLEIEKLVQELNHKSDDIREIRQMYQELQSNLHRKDLFLQQISSGNEKLRAEFGEKVIKLEDENRDVVLALSEATARIQELERKTSASDEEVSSLKRLFLVKPEKVIEAQKKEAKEVKERDEHILKLEEEGRIVRDQLKWRNEQFSHLEEAHRKLQAHFHVSKAEWQKEKTDLVDELSSLQAKLDAQIRVSESLDTQFKLCSRALAHEESRSKLLEIEVNESKSRPENVFLDYKVTKSHNLRRTKEMLFNDMSYRTAELEQQNRDLVDSMKDIQQVQVNNSARSSSAKNLRKEFQGLVQLHNKCDANLKENQAECTSQPEKLKGDLTYCLSELDGKNKGMVGVHKEFEDGKWLLEVKDEELYALIMVLKSEFHVAYSKFYDAKEKWEICSKKTEERNRFLEQQIEVKNTELHKVHAEMKHKCAEITVLMEQVEALDSLKQRDSLLEEELKRYKEMLDESNKAQCSWKAKFVELENIQREDRKNASDALRRAKSDLAIEKSKVEKSQLELQKWKVDVENLKLSIEQIQQAHEEEKANLLVSLKDQETQVGKLHEQIRVSELSIAAELKAAEMLRKEKDNYMQIAEDRKSCIESLQSRFAQLQFELSEREAKSFALLEENQSLEKATETLSCNIEKRDQKIQELQKQVETLDQNFSSAVTSFAEKESTLKESLKGANDQSILDNEESNQMIDNLEKEVYDLRKKMETQEATSIQLKQEVLHLEDSMQRKSSEMEILKGQLEKERSRFEGLLDELESQKRVLLEDLSKASGDRDELLVQLESISGQFGVISRDDGELLSMLGMMLPLSEDGSEPPMRLLSNGDFNDTIFSSSRKSTQLTVNDERALLTELNC